MRMKKMMKVPLRREENEEDDDDDEGTFEKRKIMSKCLQKD